MRTEVIGQLRL